MHNEPVPTTSDDLVKLLKTMDYGFEFIDNGPGWRRGKAAQARLRRAIRAVSEEYPEMVEALCEAHIPADYLPAYKRFYTGEYVELGHAPNIGVQNLNQSTQVVLALSKNLIQATTREDGQIGVVLHKRFINEEDMTRSWQRQEFRAANPAEFRAVVERCEQDGVTLATLDGAICNSKAFERNYTQNPLLQRALAADRTNAIYEEIRRAEALEAAPKVEESAPDTSLKARAPFTAFRMGEMGMVAPDVHRVDPPKMGF